MTHCFLRELGGGGVVWAQQRLWTSGGEYGRSVGADPAGRLGGLLYRWFRGRLAGEQDEAEVPGLEEETAPGKTVRDAEEDRPFLRRSSVQDLPETPPHPPPRNTWVRAGSELCHCQLYYRRNDLIRESKVVCFFLVSGLVTVYCEIKESNSSVAAGVEKMSCSEELHLPTTPSSVLLN